MDWQPGLVGIVALAIASSTLIYTVYSKRKETYENVLERRVDDLERKEEICSTKITGLTEEIMTLRKLNQDLMLRLVGRELRPLPPNDIT